MILKIKIQTNFLEILNKKYKERKKEINDLISFLEKKNLSLLEKIKQLEKQIVQILQEQED